MNTAQTVRLSPGMGEARDQRGRRYREFGVVPAGFPTRCLVCHAGLTEGWAAYSDWRLLGCLCPDCASHVWVER